MKVLIVDMTHGGSTLALEFSKRENCEVLAWDIYHTLQEEDRSFLENNHIQLVDDSFYANSGHDNSELVVIAPVHCNLSIPPHMTHHQAVKYLLKNEIKVPVMEITGVKGKTSVTAMLKEIYRDKNPLLLSSRGVEVLFDGEETTLQKNISITPASIITAWRLAQELYKDITRQPDICIFESSLGGTGLADVGIITNIVEDYTIAQGTSSASKAKQQMFASKVIICDHDSYRKIYSLDPATREKTNTYSIKENDTGQVNVWAHNIHYHLHKTTFQVEVVDLKTTDGKLVNTSFTVSTFAPAQYHLENTLSAISASLAMGTPPKTIIRGLENFKGLPGRTSLLKMGETVVIEEINPGINVTAVKRSAHMIKSYDKPAIVLGGSYGVTCEEIDENSLVEFLDSLDEEIPLVLTGDLGYNLNKQINRGSIYQNNIDLAVGEAKNAGGKNILLIYRSNFSELGRR